MLEKEKNDHITKILGKEDDNGLKIEKAFFKEKGRAVVATDFFSRGDFICEYKGSIQM